MAVARRTPGPGGHVPRWGLLSSGLAPLLLIGGWTLAAAVQPVPFHSLRDTISQLAAVGMPHRWVMTLGLAGLGLCHVTTAVALRPVAPAGRTVLALGGVCTALVATNPLPLRGGSGAHTVSATLAFVALSLWPALSSPRAQALRGERPPAVVRAPVRLTSTATLLALLLWFFVTLRTGADTVGLSERAVAGAQALWPLAVVLAVRTGPRAGTPALRG